MSSSSRSQQEKQRPEDVTLPPISQIFNVTSSNTSQIALPPLRTREEQSRSHQQSLSPIRARAPSSSTPASFRLTDQRDSQGKRPRFDSGQSHSYPHPPAMSRSVTLPGTQNPYQDPRSSASTRYMSSGMAMAEPSSSPHAGGRGETRYAGPPHAGYGSGLAHPGYGPSPYTYVPPSASMAHSSSYALPVGPSYGPSYTGGPPGGSFRPQEHPQARAAPPVGHVTSRGPPSGASHGTSHSESPHSGSLRPQGYPQSPPAGVTEEHSGARVAKYECSYCRKGFLRPSALKIHLISHTGEKDYVCPEESCGRRFGVRSNMLRHIRLVHQGQLSHSSGEEGSKDGDWSE
ncbi:hypothetical protein D9757_000530 [Collybiopsis confluens]|uniref:C2H2-type domain-containing protein n=1 Tax=Collybiopsis confluens TaxID=2823264 RepID=A0A8H5MG46_9AGAR|nr:hypothetical protein D9757_000530 [Collybiopsis confluens]